MDRSRKRTIRLVAALGAAVLLASGLVYTSFNASSEAREPSELQEATPGQNYEMTGKVVHGSITDRGERGIAFRVRDRQGPESIAVRYDGVVPDPFREGREIIIKGTVVNGVFEGEPDTLVTKCPSKFSEKKESPA